MIVPVPGHCIYFTFLCGPNIYAEVASIQDKHSDV